jgi:hypothetical protein
MANAESGICFWINLALFIPQNTFEFFAGWIFELFGIDPPNIHSFVGDIFACGF